MATGFDPDFYNRGGHAPQYGPEPLRIDEVVYDLPIRPSSQYSLAGPSESSRAYTPIALQEEHYHRLQHFPAHQPPTATGREYAEGRKFERKLRDNFIISGVTVGVGVPVVATAAVMGFFIGGTLGVGIGVASTLTPTVGILIGSCLSVVCSKEGRKELREAPRYVCCPSQAEEAPQVHVVERRVSPWRGEPPPLFPAEEEDHITDVEEESVEVYDV